MHQATSSSSSVMPQTAVSSNAVSGPMMSPVGMARPPLMNAPNSPMFVNQQQRTIQNSPIHSGTPSPIRSPYHSATSPSPQHPGFVNNMNQQPGMMGSFNRFHQPGMMGAPNGTNFQNNYGGGGGNGYGMQNYRMPNSQFMEGNFYGGGSQNMPGPGFSNGMRYGGGGQGQFFAGNQMHQGNFNNFNNGGNDFQQQQQQQMYGNQQQQQQQEFYGNNGGNNMGFMQQQQRIMENGGQPIPPHFRNNIMAGGMHSPGHPMGSPIGPPRISPSAMHKPMPGVGMPRVSPSVSQAGGLRQNTPLVSPQSMQSDQSPGSMHNPMTPASTSNTPGGLPHGGITSPMYNNMPKTPQTHHHSMMSASPRGGPSSVPTVPSPMTDDLRSPMGPAGCSLKSPLPYTSDLRKIRRPSKPSNAEASPPNLPQNEPLLKQEPAAPPAPMEIKPDPFAPEIKPEVKKEEVPECIFEAKWEELDPKIWRRIFRYCSYNDGSVPFLVRAQRVCKKWKEVATSDPNLWTHLDLSQGRGFRERYRNDKKLEWFLKKYNNVLELKLGGWKNAVATSTLKIAAQYCPNLISLGLCGCFKLTNEDLKLIGESFPKLERIDLSGVSPSSSSSRSAVSSTHLSDFITVLGNRLTMVNISNNKMSGLPFVFKALSAHSVNLEELDISNITTTSRDTININLEKFQKGCQKLRILNANHTMLSLTETPVREQVNSPGFPNLEELHIAVDSRGYFDGMDDTQIERVLAKSAKLRILDVRGCQHISNSCLIRLKSWVIEKLILAGCSATTDSSESIELLVKKLNKLTELDISHTPGERTVNNAVAELAEIDEPILR